MVVKINNKPIRVIEEDAEEKDFDPVYLTVSCLGYVIALWLLDYVCYTFFYIHPLPFLSFVFHWIGVVVQWLG